jgi:hypothetical protein
MDMKQYKVQSIMICKISQYNINQLIHFKFMFKLGMVVQIQLL